MRTVLITAVSTAVCAFLAAAPAFAQDTVTGAPPGQAPATVDGYGYGQGQTGQPGIGSDYPAYYGYAPGYRYYWPGYGYYAPGPFGPVGAAVGAWAALQAPSPRERLAWPQGVQPTWRGATATSIATSTAGASAVLDSHPNSSARLAACRT